MRAKKVIQQLHLVLGLSSGIVVFIISITGCLYAFQEEIQNFVQPYRFVETEYRSVLPPSTLIKTASAKLPGKHVHAVLYKGIGESARVIFYAYEPEYYYYQIYLNPYSGKILAVEDMTANFFQVILDGHFYLWLPPVIGQPIAASATLIFFILLITGLILWWPKKASKKQQFTIRWNARWRRKNYDLHRVLGFYILIFGLILSVTGLVWGFQWFAKTYYTIAGGKKSLVYEEPLSDTTRIYSQNVPAIDVVYQKMIKMYPGAKSMEVHTPEFKSSSIAANANSESGTFYKTDYRYFDQFTFSELNVTHIYGRYTSATKADKLFRMNYDIHVGAIGGIPGKIIAFLASLVCASLPVTGTLLWWGRRKKEKKEKAKTDAKTRRVENARFPSRAVVKTKTIQN